MPPIEDREGAEEARYARHEEPTFRVKARRNKLLALWALEKMGRPGAAAPEQAGELVDIVTADDTDAAVIARIGAPLSSGGIFVPAAESRKRLERFGAAARDGAPAR